MSISIKEVISKEDLKMFIYLPEKIHKNHKNWLHPLYMAVSYTHLDVYKRQFGDRAGNTKADSMKLQLPTTTDILFILPSWREEYFLSLIHI